MTQTGNLIGKYAPDFELPGVDGNVHHLTRYLQEYRAVCVVFMCNHCPYVKLYLDRLKQIQADFEAQGCILIGINANDASKFPEDSFDNMKLFAQERQLNFPYLWDATQDVARCFRASRTPEAFLIDSSGVLQYIGAVDDSPNNPESVNTNYLRDAITQLLNGQAVSNTSFEAIGCSVKWRD